MKFLKIAAALAAFAAPVWAHDFHIGDLTVDHPFGYVAPNGARAAGGFVTITNSGAEADRLIAVEADFPRVELHNHVMDANGVASMMEMEDGIEIPAGGTVALAPGGLHVMFMGLESPLEAGAHVEAVLVFEKAGRLDVVFHFEARPMGEGHDAHAGHSAHGHSHSHSDNN